MSNGNFCWYELMTTDPVAAAAFYTNVVGWRAEDSGLPGMDYTIVRMDETGIGGIMAVPDEAAKAGARPCWLGYISVDDVDAMAARITAAGGSVKRAAADIAQVGRFAVVADPQGAVFIVFKANATTEPAPVAPGTPGHGGWHELHADDWEKVFPFYGELFGWAKSNAMDMGPMGVYQLFA
jgi:predicted enzyme related to lactoylglutathione lyase